MPLALPQPPALACAAASAGDALPASARTQPGRARAQVDSASFGADAASALGVDVSVWVRRLSHTGGPGICVNYYTDGPSEHNNGGRGYLEALQQLRPGTLRYPGGEKSDSCARPRAAAGTAWLRPASLCMRKQWDCACGAERAATRRRAARRYAWAPPPWTEETKPRPTLTRCEPADWPFSDPNIITGGAEAVTCAPRAGWPPNVQVSGRPLLRSRPARAAVHEGRVH